MILEPELLADIEALLATTGETPTAFGRRVAADPSLVSDLRTGRSVGRRLREKIQAALITIAATQPTES
jgi:2,4-dienoyl-CoA reductase-like NADH-dependent reductase (Old Yellow Enzyme family)